MMTYDGPVYEVGLGTTKELAAKSWNAAVSEDGE